MLILLLEIAELVIVPSQIGDDILALMICTNSRKENISPTLSFIAEYLFAC